jgi:hypothetical protein
LLGCRSPRELDELVSLCLLTRTSGRDPRHVVWGVTRLTQAESVLSGYQTSVVPPHPGVSILP